MAETSVNCQQHNKCVDLIAKIVEQLAPQMVSQDIMSSLCNHIYVMNHATPIADSMLI